MRRTLTLATLLCALAPLAPAQTTGPVGERVRLDDLGGLLIDRTEVTIGQFARYAQASGVRTRAEQEGGGFEYLGGWQRRPGWTWRQPDGVPASADLPAVHLTHAEAAAYCRWAGGRLPTAAEWRRAAFTELRAAPPAPWVRGKTYPWPTGESPQGANTSDPDPWPRAARSRKRRRASTACTTWGPTSGNGRPTRAAASARPWAAPGGTRPGR